jgi:hypothetical protein
MGGYVILVAVENKSELRFERGERELQIGREKEKISVKVNRGEKKTRLGKFFLKTS